jgi:enoyl-CoA hydratase
MSEIIVEKADKVVSVIIDRPPVNALTIALYQRIADVFEEISTFTDVNCVVLLARGSRAFCAGLDLREFLAAKVEDDPARAVIVRRMFHSVRHCAIPVIAAVNGPALGAGCVLASVCDIRIASENATFGLPEINVGRCGGTAHMARHIPQGLLRRMFFTGTPISAQEAYRVGFVDGAARSPVDGGQ